MNLGIAVPPRAIKPGFVASPKAHCLILDRPSLPFEKGFAEQEAPATHRRHAERRRGPA